MTQRAIDRGPKYYKDLGIEPWAVVDTWSSEQRIGFYRGCLLKYTMRMADKDSPVQNISKAEHYAQKLKEVLAEQEMAALAKSVTDAVTLY